LTRPETKRSARARWLISGGVAAVDRALRAGASRSSSRSGLAVATALAAIAWWTQVLVPALTEHGGPVRAWDLSALLVGAKVLAGQGAAGLYEHNATFYNAADGKTFADAAAALGFDGVPTPFVQAPLVAWLARPLTALSYLAVVRGCMALNVVSAVVGVVVCIELYAPSVWRSRLAVISVVGACAFFEPIRYAVYLGQTTPVIFLLAMLALRVARRRRDAWAGGLLALPAFIKLTPLALAIPWLVRRRVKALATLAVGLMALGAASVTATSLKLNLDYVARIRQIGSITLVAYNNQSFIGTLARQGMSLDDVSKWRMITPSPAERIAAGAAVLTVLALFVRRRRTACSPLSDPFVQDGASFLLLLLAPTISWTHYFVFLIPLAMVTFRALRLRGMDARLAAVLGLGPLVLCVRPLIPAQDEPLLLTPHTFVAGPTVAAACYLVVLLVVHARTFSAASDRLAPSGVAQ
jgi:hypothetical protein